MRRAQVRKIGWVRNLKPGSWQACPSRSGLDILTVPRLPPKEGLVGNLTRETLEKPSFAEVGSDPSLSCSQDGAK